MKNIVAMLLCAGEGTRMGNTGTNKVCMEVAGIPAVIRTITNMKKAGIEKFIVVVGSRSEKVMQCLSGIDGISYAFQSERSGTGNAAMCGLSVMNSFDCDGPVLIAMGDKIISQDVISDLISKYDNESRKAVFAVVPKAFNQSGGRICQKGGKVCGIYEMLDSALLHLASAKQRTQEGFAELIDTMNISEKKKGKLLKTAMANADKLESRAELAGCEFSYEEIEQSEFVNTATYIADCKMLTDAVSGLNSQNAQGEIYLTDALNEIIKTVGAEIVPVFDESKILTYSTMDELIALNRFFVEAPKNNDMPNASERIAELYVWNEKIQSRFAEIYGKNDILIEDRKKTIIELLQAFINKYGDRPCVIVRSPGRVNLLGRHIEHRGGSINVMSIDRETLAVCASREDDTVNISNLSPRFNDASFGILKSISECDTSNWLEYIEHEEILKMVRENSGDWSNYVKAAVLRLQLENRSNLLCGMDMMFTGNIPVAAGLSSSSSIVVATAEAAIALNKIDMEAKDFIHLCGEGEWFVGSRGGAGDHAAMKCGKRDMITHLDFCPFEIGESVEFPKDYSVVVANSFVEAKKSEGAKDKFNQKVACYEFGFMMIKKKYPEYASKLRYFKNISSEHLGVRQSKIYRMLLSLPEYMTADEIKAELPENLTAIERIMKTHSIPDRYEIRSTVLYGIAECERANICIKLLKNGDYRALGELMNISHNGDRVSLDDKPYDYSCSDKYLLNLIDNLSSENPEKVREAQIYRQPGGYACSTPTIDNLCDFIVKQEGVLGAELSGAGLGGCIIILVKKEKVSDLLSSLKEYYYDKNGFRQGAAEFVPVAGSCTI